MQPFCTIQERHLGFLRLVQALRGVVTSIAPGAIGLRTRNAGPESLGSTPALSQRGVEDQNGQRRGVPVASANSAQAPHDGNSLFVGKGALLGLLNNQSDEGAHLFLSNLQPTRVLGRGDVAKSRLCQSKQEGRQHPLPNDPVEGARLLAGQSGPCSHHHHC